MNQLEPSNSEKYLSVINSDLAVCDSNPNPLPVSVEGTFQLPLCVLTFPEEVDYLIDHFIKLHIAATNPNLEFVHPLRKALHYGVYLTVSYETCQKCVEQYMEIESNKYDDSDHHHKMSPLKIPELVYAKNVNVDDSMNIMHDVYKPDPNIPLVSVNASGVGSLSSDEPSCSVTEPVI